MLKSRKPVALAAALVVALGIGGTAVATAATASSGSAAAPPAQAHHPGPPGPREIVATPVTKVAPLDPPSAFGHTTLLEGDAFGPNGNLYFVNLTAPSGQPKILELDLRTNKIVATYTDNHSSLSSLQFSPADGKIYVTDFFGGKVDRLNTNLTGFQTVFSGPVQGRTMVPDDIAFNPAGDMYLSDYQGTPFAPTGRIVRLDAQGHNPIVVQTGLSSPNGISFTPDFTGLWISELNLGREDHLTLSADGKSVTAASVGMSANIGLGGFDSNTVDGAGNVYQCDVGAGRILVWNQLGDHIATVVVRQSVRTLTTNLAIRPGSTDGYMVVGGTDGGYIYKFRALAKGIPQSNGGGA